MRIHTRCLSICLVLFVFLTFFFSGVTTASSESEEIQTRGLSKSFPKAIEKIVDKLEKQLEKDKKYVVTVAGVHPTTGPNLNFSSYVEAEIAKEFSSRSRFSVAFYKDNAEAMKLIQFSQTAYFDRAIELGKFVSADYLVTGEYAEKEKGKAIHLVVTIQDLQKNLKIAGEDIDIKKKGLPKNIFEQVPVDPKPLEECLEELVEDINYENMERPRLLIGNFTYADTPIPSTFGSYVKEKIQSILVSSQRFVVVSGKDADTINAGEKMSSGQSMRGLSQTVNMFVTGRYWDMGDAIGIGLILRDDQDQILHSREIEIDRKSIPGSIEIKPDNLDQIKNQIQTFEKFDPPPAESKKADDLIIKVWPDKGTGAVYKKGENVKFYFKSNRDCYLILVHTDKDGKVQYLFPNGFARDNLIKGNKLYTIPDDSYGFNIDVTEPYGFEMIKALASTRQFDEIKKINWDSMGDVFVEGSVRGLTVNAKAAIQATDECTLTTAEK